jgi:hypothetical protein
MWTRGKCHGTIRAVEDKMEFNFFWVYIFIVFVNIVPPMWLKWRRSRRYQRFLKTAQEGDRKILESRTLHLGVPLDLRVQHTILPRETKPKLEKQNEAAVDSLLQMGSLPQDFWQQPETDYTLDGPGAKLSWGTSSLQIYEWLQSLKGVW